MHSPIPLPIAPMLARAVQAVPDAPGYGYEPKWDGFRCIILRDGDEVELGSRGQKPLTPYFPELVAALTSGGLPARCVVDAEVIVRMGEPGAEHLSWESLSQRIHPAASRIARLSAETPAEVVCFDLLALDAEDLQQLPYRTRRRRLEEVFSTVTGDSIHLSAMTLDADLARRWFVDFEGAGLDGVIAKPLEGSYEQGKRSMLKVKHRRTCEAVVLGYRVHKRGHGVGSLLLGLYDRAGALLPVGGIGAFSDQMRDTLERELAPLVVTDEAGEAVTLDRPRSRFSAAPDTAVVALEPSLVVEVAFDQLEGRRFRHAVTFLRFRPDRDPQSCLLDQVDRPIGYDLARVFSQ